jgi:hypothetical protein
MMVPAKPTGSRASTSSQSIEGKGFNITLPVFQISARSNARKDAAMQGRKLCAVLCKRADQIAWFTAVDFVPSSIWWQPTKMPKYVEVHSGYEPSMHLKTACRLGAAADPDKSDGQTHRD